MSFTNEGILLSCDFEGIIRKVYYNKIGNDFNDIEGRLFIDIFNHDVVGKALQFLVEIKKNSASFGWELNLKTDHPSKAFYFSGVLIDNSITILGTRTKVDFAYFLNGMIQINNEQTNKIREFEKLKRSLIADDKGAQYFDELSRLNNELVSVQRELTKKNLELEELNNLKNQFLGMAAHDLRNPLGNILSYSEFIEEEKDNLSQEQAEFIAQIKSLSSFMLNMVTELLDVTTIESGKISLKIEPCNLTELISRNIHLNKNFADKKQIKLIFTKTEIANNLMLDKGKIEQVITNLITNAIKYSHPKTEITVDLSMSNDELIISVKDQGQGIPEDEQHLLFKPFQKTSTKSTGGEKSTGLGLFIVKKIVEAHKGKIWVESKPGVGSTFFVSLPLVV